MKEGKERVDFKYNFKIYLELLKKYKLLFAVLLFTSLVIESSRVIDRFIFKSIIDHGTEYAAGTLLQNSYTQLLLIFLFVFLGLVIFRAAADWALHHMINVLDVNLMKDLKEGDEVVLSEMEHHSNIVPWQQLAKNKNVKVKYICVNDDYELDLEHARELINKKTKIVSVMHVSNVLGTINDVKEIGGLAKNVGAVFIVDSAQGAPHFSVDVKEIDCDFLCFSGHKMLGPTGIGILSAKEELQEKMELYYVQLG